MSDDDTTKPAGDNSDLLKISPGTPRILLHALPDGGKAAAAFKARQAQRHREELERRKRERQAKRK